MPKRKRPDPRTMTGPELLRAMARSGRKCDQNLIEGKRHAQFFYEKFGDAVIGKFPDFTVDDRGRVHVPDEYRLWSNGWRMLELLAGSAMSDDWIGPHVQAMLQEWAAAGIEAPGVVWEVARELAATGSTLSPSDVSARLMAAADRIEREAREADR